MADHMHSTTTVIHVFAAQVTLSLHLTQTQILNLTPFLSKLNIYRTMVWLTQQYRYCQYYPFDYGGTTIIETAHDDVKRVKKDIVEYTAIDDRCWPRHI